MMIPQPLPDNVNDNNNNNNNNNNTNNTNTNTNNQVNPWDNMITVNEPWGPPPSTGGNNTTANQIAWRERERRQRSVRMLMMFLMMLLLMDGEEQQQIQRRKDNAAAQALRKQKLKMARVKHVDTKVYQKRINQDTLLYSALSTTSPRFKALIHQNDNQNVEQDLVRSWVTRKEQQQQLEELRALSVGKSQDESQVGTIETNEEEKDGKVISGKKVFHYPWNTTGFYRGEWTKQDMSSTPPSEEEEEEEEDTDDTVVQEESDIVLDVQDEESNEDRVFSKVQYKTPLELESTLQSWVVKRAEANSHNNNNNNKNDLGSKTLTLDDTMGVYCLPPKTKFKTLDSQFNSTKLRIEEKEAIEAMKTKRYYDPAMLARTRTRTTTATHHHQKKSTTTSFRFLPSWVSSVGQTSLVELLEDESPSEEEEEEDDPLLYELPLTRTSGRIGLQFYARSVPGMKELSLMDGFVKLYDSATVGYSTRRDVLLRVKGVIIHPIGKISMVANTLTGRSAFVIPRPHLSQKNMKKKKREKLSLLTDLVEDDSQGQPEKIPKQFVDMKEVNSQSDGEGEGEGEGEGDTSYEDVDVDADVDTDSGIASDKKERRRRLEETLSKLVLSTHQEESSFGTSDTQHNMEERIRQDTMALWSFDVTKDEPDEIVVDSGMDDLFLGWQDNNIDDESQHQNPFTIFSQMELQEYFGSMVSHISSQLKHPFQRTRDDSSNRSHPWRHRRRLSTVRDDEEEEEVQSVEDLVNDDKLAVQDDKSAKRKKNDKKKTLPSSKPKLVVAPSSSTTKKGKKTKLSNDESLKGSKTKWQDSSALKGEETSGTSTGSTQKIPHGQEADLKSKGLEGTDDNDYLTKKPLEVESEDERRYKMEYSDYVFPFPYVMDDKKGSLEKQKTPASRKMPQREIPLEANAGRCEFELNFDVKPVEWTVGEWRALVQHHVHDSAMLNPAILAAEAAKKKQEEEEAEIENEKHNKDTKKKKRHGTNGEQETTQHLKKDGGISNKVGSARQALVMEIVGVISSPNCDFTATVNATAVRTNWESTTGRAINYSFYMMLTCLTQIVVLLRQLLHSQPQSAAMRVSLLSIGWQTVLDALLCLGHISLSLAMQPLFTAFASVAFFKLLIFCVIEMKYMAIIMQARNGGNNTTELLRRQVTMLHLRFYVALMGVLMLFFYAGEDYRTIYMLTLYSFWVPQIILNVVTEAKRPLHHYYIYGMSVSRLVAPLYIFAVPNNFLKEVYPDAPNDPQMCQCLVLWIGIQTAVLIAQEKYGARFMIPARFLPPKFDYSRPIPESLLPPGATQTSESEMSPFTEDPSPASSPPVTETIHDLSPTRKTSSTSAITSPSTHRLAATTRNRIKGSRNRIDSAQSCEKKSSMETVIENTRPIEASPLTLDCVICYNPIDIQNRRGYMLAPCDHIFHRDCLMQWMDVKMECPICRTELPAL